MTSQPNLDEPQRSGGDESGTQRRGQGRRGRRKPRRQRGNIDELPSGSKRVRVYAGVDPISKRPYYLTEVVSADHPDQDGEVKRVLYELVARVDEKRHPRTRASVAYLMDKYLDGWDGDRSTLNRYRDLVRLHIRPLIGDEPVARIDGEIIDSLLTELRRCRIHCDRKTRTIDHRTRREHECDHRCKPHVCKGLARWTIRKIYWLLHAAFEKAVRIWKWIDHNSVADVDPPAPPPSKPKPPSTEQAAQILNEAWRRDPEWGLLVWLTMITGMRRGELCGIRRPQLDLVTKVLAVDFAVGVDGAELYEKDTKDHKDRRIVLDDFTVALLRAYLIQCEQRALTLGINLANDMYLFSPEPDHTKPYKPPSVSGRYRRMAARLGIQTSIHRLRHYSATELIAGGVDIRTVAGRLGHGGGGATTLKVYAAFVSEADQRAASTLLARLPKPPVEIEPNETFKTTVEQPARGPYDNIAADLRAAIRCGVLSHGDQLPTVKDLGAQYCVAPSTVHRAFQVLREEGLIDVARGRRATARGDRSDRRTSPSGSRQV